MTGTDNRLPQSQAPPAPGGNDGHTFVSDPRVSQPEQESQQYSQQPTQQQDPTTQQSHNPGPPPFDPMSQHHHSHPHHHGSPTFGSNALGQSVVPDLMKVYESLTQSSTPQRHGAAHLPASTPQGTALAQTQELPQQHSVEQPTVDANSQHSQTQQPQYHYYQPVPAPAPAQQRAEAPDAAQPATGDASLHYYVHPHTEVQQQPPPQQQPQQHHQQQHQHQQQQQQQQASSSVYYQVPQQQQQGQYQHVPAPQPQQQQAHHQYVAYLPQHASAPPAQPPVASQQPPSSHPPAVAGTDPHHGTVSYPSYAPPLPVHHTQQVQVAQPQQAAPPTQALSTNPIPVPPPQSSSTSPQPPVPTRSSSRKRNSTGSDDGSTFSRARSRKKGGSADGRWSKRFQWPDELHREFVSAVFDVGLKHSSPSAIQEHMTPNAAITSERIKSHLQKYRLHRQRSKREFMSSYDSAMGKFKSAPGGVVVDPEEVRTLSCGEVAAHLSCSTISDPKVKADPGANSEIAHPLPPLPASNAVDVGLAPVAAPVAASAPNQPPQGSRPEAQAGTQGSYGGGALHLPQLTEEEKRSPIGASMGYLMGLFFSLEQQLALQRTATAANDTAASAAQGVSSSAVTPGTAGAPATTKYVPIIAAPIQGQGSSTPMAQASAPMPPPQAAPVPAPAPAPAPTQFAQPSQAPAPPPSSQAHPQDQTPSDRTPVPAPAGPAGPTSLVSHPSFQPPPANARHPTQPHLPLHSHSASIIEENDMMKRDMRSQMALQNKMRALKEQEQRKYRTSTDSSTGPTKNEAKSKDEGRVVSAEKSKSGAVAKAIEGADGAAQSQVVGESSNGEGSNTDRSLNTATEPPAPVAGQAAPGGRNRPGSATEAVATKAIGQNEVATGAAPDEFWNADVVDEQLFEFLMS